MTRLSHWHWKTLLLAALLVGCHTDPDPELNTCATATNLSLAARHQVLTGDLSGSGEGTGAYHRLTLAEDSLLDLQVDSAPAADGRPGTAGFTLLMPDCQTQWAQNPSWNPSDTCLAPYCVRKLFLPAGSYVLGVTPVNAEEPVGRYTLTVDREPAPVVVGNRCSAPDALPLPAGLTERDLELRGVAQVRPSPCREYGDELGDNVSTFELTEQEYVVTEEQSGGFLNILRDCQEPGTSVCWMSAYDPTRHHRFQRGPGRFFLVGSARAASDTGGRVVARLWKGTPLPEPSTQTNAQPLELSSAHPIDRRGGDFASGTREPCPCDPARLCENLYYRISTRGQGDRKLDVWLYTPGFSQTARVALLQDTGTPNGPELLACGALGRPMHPSLGSRPLTEGDYFLVVGRDAEDPEPAFWLHSELRAPTP